MAAVSEGCRVCFSTDGTPWGEENGFAAVRCSQCGLVYLSPWPDLAERDRALQYGAHEGDKTLNTNNPPGGAALVRDYQSVLSDLYGNTLAARRVSWLDIGCGYGEFLEALKATVGPGSTLKGSEPNKHKTSYARSRGLDVEYRELDQLREQFSHVSLLNVFSHLPEPIPFLSMARDLLEPGGELLLQTGNGGDVTRREFPGELWFPDHLTFAGRKTLELVVEKLQMQLLGIHAYRSPPLTPMNVAKDLVKRVIRKDYNPVDWRGPFRTLWLRARKA